MLGTPDVILFLLEGLDRSYDGSLGCQDRKGRGGGGAVTPRGLAAAWVAWEARGKGSAE